MGGQWAQPLVRSVDLNCDGEPGDGYAGVWWWGARGVCVCVCVCGEGGVILGQTPSALQKPQL